MERALAERRIGRADAGAQVDHAEALVAGEAKRLRAVAGAAIGIAASGIDRVAADVVVAVQVERLDHAVVARLAEVLAMAALTVGLVRRRNARVVTPEGERVGVAPQRSIWHQLTRRELGLERAVAPGKVAGGAARRRAQAPEGALRLNGAVVARQAQAHLGQAGARGQIDPREVSVAAPTRDLALGVRAVVEAQAHRRRLDALHFAAGPVPLVARRAAGGRRGLLFRLRPLDGVARAAHLLRRIEGVVGAARGERTGVAEVAAQLELEVASVAEAQRDPLRRIDDRRGGGQEDDQQRPHQNHPVRLRGAAWPDAPSQ
jgi:hypothetical protein